MRIVSKLMLTLALNLLIIGGLQARVSHDERHQHDISGVIFENTDSAKAAQFAQWFTFYWLDYPVSENATLVIRENQSARRGKQLWVQYQNTILFQYSLTYQRQDLQSAAQQAAQQVAEQVANLQNFPNALDPDLAEDELP